jgi:cyanuric acid amidohydrolase
LRAKRPAAEEAPVPVAKVHRISANGPDDASGIARAIEDGRIDPRGVIAVFGKTEGNGCVNDFSRGFATLTLTQFFAQFMPRDDAEKICFVMSGGTEGAMAPHWTVFERAEGEGASPALAIGRAHTTALPPEDLGRAGQIALVADGVRAAMRDAGIADPADVHFVQIKCPLLTAQRIGEATARGKTVATSSTLKSMRLRLRTGTSARTGRCIPAAPVVRPASNCWVMKSWCSACRRPGAGRWSSITQ